MRHWRLSSGTGSVERAAPVSGQPGVDAVLRAVPLTRMLDYGVPLADAEQFVAAVVQGAGWVETGTGLARSHRHDATVAERLGLVVAARQHRSASAALELVSQLGVDADEEARRVLYGRAVADVTRAGWERLAVDVDGRHAVCWLRTAPDRDATAMTLIWGGTSGWGPVYARTAARLASPRMAVGLVELPGQGEPRLLHGSVLDSGFPDVVDALLDELVARIGPGARFAVVGNSMGGLLAARVAAALPRISACVVNGGVARPAGIVQRHPRQRRQWELMLGTDDELELLDVLDGLALDPSRDRLACPALIFHGARDPLVTQDDVDCFAAAVQAPASAASLVVHAPDGEHCLYNRSEDRDAVLADWLHGVLSGDGR